MPSWPATLPRPTIAGYGIEPEDPVIRTDMDGGNVRARRRSNYFPSMIPVQWRFTTAEFAVFEAWHKLEAQDGVAWFDVELANGLALTSYSAQFRGMWKATALAGLHFDVKATLMVKSRPALAANYLEAATAYAPGDITYGTPTLHTLIHTTLPSASYW